MAIKYAIGTLAQWNALTAGEQAEYAGHAIDLYTWYNNDGYDLDVTDNITFEALGDHQWNTDASALVADSHLPKWNGYTLKVTSRSGRATITMGAGNVGPVMFNERPAYPSLGTGKLHVQTLSFSLLGTTNLNAGIINANKALDVEIDDCWFDLANGVGRHAVFIYDGSLTTDFRNVTINRCKFFNDTNGDLVQMFIRNSLISEASTIIVKSCSFYNSDYDGLYINLSSRTDYGSTTTIENCSFYNIYVDGIAYRTSSSGWSHNLHLKNLVVSRPVGITSDGSVYFWNVSDLSSGTGEACYDSSNVYYISELFGTSAAGPHFVWSNTRNDVDPDIDFLSVNTSSNDFLLPTPGEKLAINGVTPTYATEDLNGDPIPGPDGLYSIGAYEFQGSSNPPDVNFIGTPLVGPASVTTQFTDLTTGSPISWLWDFGDGTSSTAQNPLKNYNNIGTYTVSLTATNPNGSETITKVSYVTVNFPENAYYVDLNKGYTGTGSQDNPLNYQDFSIKTNAGDNTYDYMIRGNINLDHTKHNDYVGALNVNMRPWSLSQYGPWRIHVPTEGFCGYSLRAREISGAIIQTDMNSSYQRSVALNIWLCGTTIENSHIRSNDRLIINIIGDAYLCGSNLIGATGGNTIIKLDDSVDNNSVVIGIKDSIIDARDIGVTGGEAKLCGSSLYTENTVFNHGGINRLGNLTGITGIHKYPQFDYDLPESWPDWDSGAQGSTGIDDPSKWAAWSTWGKLIRVGSGSYTNINTGLFGNTRLGVGALYFDASPTFTVSSTKSDYINALSKPLKTSNKFIAMGWVKYPATSDGGALYPLVVADLYGRVLEDGAASFKLAIKREGEDYRLQFSGSQSKLIKRELNIDLRDNGWHFLVYACINDDGLMKYYVDGIVLPSDTTLDSAGISKGIARSENVRLGGGGVYCPYLYEAGTSIALYNWRVGFSFVIHQEWIQDLMKIDKTNLGIS